MHIVDVLRVERHVVTVDGAHGQSDIAKRWIARPQWVSAIAEMVVYT